MSRLFDIIIPTWNNPVYLNSCVESIFNTHILDGFGRIIVVNNGSQPIKERYKYVQDKVLVIDSEENLGWERGLELGLKHSDAPFVCFQNDDTYLPKSSIHFYNKLMMPFRNPNVAAVGPITTIATGLQSIYNPQTPMLLTEAPWLIFFCVMIKREYLDAVGGVDTTLPGGDDFDLSIRFRRANKTLLIEPSAFIIHHGFKTGERVRGGPEKIGGWNNQEMIDRTNRHLIRKHGFGNYIRYTRPLEYRDVEIDYTDKEGNVIRSILNGEVKIIELGCGHKKTIDKSIGVDIIKKGDAIPNLKNAVSCADIQADVSKSMPIEDNSADAVIARHILEHCLDVVGTLKEWKRILKPGGKMILAVPDEDIVSAIPMNPEHKHAFGKESLRSIMDMLGMKMVDIKEAGNGMSMVGVFKKDA